METFTNTENTIKAKIFLLANAKTISEIIKDTPIKKIVIHKSILGSPKNNIFFQLFMRKISQKLH